MKKENIIRYKLCTQGSCCPIVEISEQNVKLSDDFGGQVILTRAEADLLLDKLLELRKK